MANPVIQFPDAIMVIIEHLRASLPGTLVYSRIPEDRPAEFIRVRRIGGLRNTIVTDRPRVDVHCWGPTEADAEALMSIARAHVLAMGGSRSGTTVYRVTEVGGPQWLPDNESGSPRYAFAIEFSLRGRELE